ncbi:hypothetical protein [Idiomarina loihiensis]|uniref:hypothetical protein n=1 Tax=Idiomarina loihiensis TaxID=135577 RepID=UPI003850BF64
MSIIEAMMPGLNIDKLVGVYELIEREKKSALASIIFGNPSPISEKLNIDWHHYYELSDKDFRRAFMEASGQERLKGKLEYSERLKIFNELESALAAKDDVTLRSFLCHTNHEELLAISIAARFNFEAVKKFQRTINDMLVEVRAKSEGYESLMFKAAKIDSMVISTDTFSGEQRNRVLNGDMSFIKKLSQAINPSTSDKRQRHTNTVRFLIYSLHKSSGKFPTVDELVSFNRKHEFVAEGEDIGEAFRYHLREYEKISRRK